MDQPEAACSKWKREADILFLPQVPKPRSDLAKLGLSFPKKRGKSFGLSSRLNSTDWTESRISTVADSLSDKKKKRRGNSPSRFRQSLFNPLLLVGAGDVDWMWIAWRCGAGLRARGGGGRPHRQPGNCNYGSGTTTILRPPSTSWEPFENLAQEYDSHKSCTSKLNRRVSPERWGVQAMTKCKQFTSRFFHSESFSQTASSQPWVKAFEKQSLSEYWNLDIDCRNNSVARHFNIAYRLNCWWCWMVCINIDSQSLLFKAQKLNDNFMMLCASHFGTKHCLLVWQIFCLFLERGLHSCAQELLQRQCMRRPMAIYRWQLR